MNNDLNQIFIDLLSLNEIDFESITQRFDKMSARVMTGISKQLPDLDNKSHFQELIAKIELRLKEINKPLPSFDEFKRHVVKYYEANEPIEP